MLPTGSVRVSMLHEASIVRSGDHLAAAITELDPSEQEVLLDKRSLQTVLASDGVAVAEIAQGRRRQDDDHDRHHDGCFLVEEGDPHREVILSDCGLWIADFGLIRNRHSSD